MKKATVATKILNLLNTFGGCKPKDIIKATKLNPASVYTTLNGLRKQGKIAKEEDGVYISQTQTSTTPSKVTVKIAPVDKVALTANYVKKLEAENIQYHGWCLQWREKHDKLEQALAITESELADAKAVIRYLEGRIL